MRSPRADRPSRPVLRYHGGKFQLAPWVASHFPGHRVYTEVYGGAASVLMYKPRSYAEVYNDLSGEVVNVFRVLRDPETAADLGRRLALTPFAREEFKAAYAATEDLVERARMTVVRSFMGFGSDATRFNRKTGFRSNTSRCGTTAAVDWGRWPGHIPEFVERLKGVCIENRPAVEVLAEHDEPRALHYVDPPYPHSTRTMPVGYEHEMTDEDHRRLAEVLKALRGFVVVSGYRCELYDELFAGWKRIEKDVIVFRASRRKECLWLSPRTVAAGASMLF